MDSSAGISPTVAPLAAGGIAITDLDGRFVRTNTAFDRIVDRTVAGPDQATLFDLIRSSDGPNLREAYQDLLDGDRERLVLRPELLCRNGETIRISLTASLLRDADGAASDYVTIIVEDGTGRH